ncbi:MAG: hypothetical protein WDZ69_01530 [Candidatus Pacearchaeota archaeon]
MESKQLYDLGEENYNLTIPSSSEKKANQIGDGLGEILKRKGFEHLMVKDREKSTSETYTKDNISAGIRVKGKSRNHKDYKTIVSLSSENLWNNPEFQGLVGTIDNYRINMGTEAVN